MSGLNLDDLTVNSLTYGFDNSVWISTRNPGVAHYRNEVWIGNYCYPFNIAGNQMKDLFTDHSGNIWAAGSASGVRKFDGLDWCAHCTSGSGMPCNNVNTAKIAPDNVIWIGTMSGLAVLNDTAWSNMNTGNCCLPGDNIKAIEIVNENKWVGTSAGLVINYNSDTLVLTTDNSDLPSNNIQAICGKDNYSAWVGTDQGLVRLGIFGTVIQHESNFPGQNVTSIIRGLDGTFWASSLDAGIAHFIQGEWIPYNTSNSCIPCNAVTSLACDYKGRIVMGTSGAGFTTFDGANWCYFNTLNSGLPDNDIRAVGTEGSTIWLGTAYSGLVQFDGTTFTVFNTNNSGIPNNTVTSLTVSPEGLKWVGTDGGLAVYSQNGTNTLIPVLRCATQKCLVYPNPASSFISLELSPDLIIHRVEIYNSIGAMILTSNKNNRTVEISNLQPGNYLVKVFTNSKTCYSKLVVKH
jgi:ligand-binding sensor domain-containing protein